MGRFLPLGRMDFEPDKLLDLAIIRLTGRDNRMAAL
jgi:hypothetical protein